MKNMKLERQLSTPNFWKSEMERDGKALWGAQLGGGSL